jgi:hypothetical protein
MRISLFFGLCGAFCIGCPGDVLLPSAEPPPTLPFICPLKPPTADDTPMPAADPDAIGTIPELNGCTISGRTMSRLNRTEYNNTVQDLLLVDLSPANDFPDDDTHYGFDNISDALTIAPLLVEKYNEAARTLIEAALDKGLPKPELTLYETETHWGAPRDLIGTRLGNEQVRRLPLHIPLAGDYLIRVRAYGEQAGYESPQLELQVNGSPIAVFEVPQTSANPAVFETQHRLTVGFHVIGIGFLNDYNRNQTRNQERLDRALVVDYIELDGPHDPPEPPMPAARANIMICDPEESGQSECAQDILMRFASRAYRRPVSDSDLQRLQGFLDVAAAEGEGFEEGIAMALRAILLSPEFLFRVERDKLVASDAPQLLNDHELASRLSYFLWSSMPDERLSQLANENALTDPEVLSTEIDRMLSSPKSQALVENFGGQWLQSRGVKNKHFDPELYPDADALLKDSMQCETDLMFDHILRENLPVQELVNAEYTFLNKRLAVHYSLEAPEADRIPEQEAHSLSHFGLAPLAETNRKGILTQGSFLALGSHPDRTSPVRRGKWVLDQLLCMPPPPPPPDIPGFPEETNEAATVRERMEAHRSDPFCASCHVNMDPIGFAFENYDATGVWRDEESGQQIDASGLFLEQHHFEGAHELAELIAADARLGSCATEKLLTYAIGRGLVEADACTLDSLVGVLNEKGFGSRDLIREIAMSGPFRMRVQVDGTPSEDENTFPSRQEDLP